MEEDIDLVPVVEAPELLEESRFGGCHGLRLYPSAVPCTTPEYPRQVEDLPDVRPRGLVDSRLPLSDHRPVDTEQFRESLLRQVQLLLAQLLDELRRWFQRRQIGTRGHPRVIRKERCKGR